MQRAQLPSKAERSALINAASAPTMLAHLAAASGGRMLGGQIFARTHARTTGGPVVQLLLELVSHSNCMVT